MKQRRNIILGFSVVFLLILAVFLGYQLGKSDRPNNIIESHIFTENPQKHPRILQFRVSDTNKDKTKTITQDSTQLFLNGKWISITDTLQNNMMSEELFLAYAKIDSQNGFCEEHYKSENGLSQFFYVYPEVELRFIHDLYELPNGTQHLIDSMTVSDGLWSRPNAKLMFWEDDGIFSYRLDREIWGLMFQPQVRHNGIIDISVQQHGGQQIGQLEIINYVLYDTSGSLLEESQSSSEFITIPIQTDSTTSFQIDVGKRYPNLQAGKYVLQFLVQDIYTEDMVHPLMRNYFDIQEYNVEIDLQQSDSLS